MSKSILTVAFVLGVVIVLAGCDELGLSDNNDDGGGGGPGELYVEFNGTRYSTQESSTPGDDPFIDFYLDNPGADQEWRLIFARGYSAGMFDYSTAYPGFAGAAFFDGWSEFLFYSASDTAVDAGMGSTGFGESDQGAFYYSPPGVTTVYVASRFDAPYGDASFGINDRAANIGDVGRGRFDGDPARIVSWTDASTYSINNSETVAITEGEYRLLRSSDQ